MAGVDVRFEFNKEPEIAFTGRGRIDLHDTCLVISGPVFRYRIPLLPIIIDGLLTSRSYRTVPYGAVEDYWVNYTLRRRRLTLRLFRKLHTVKYRLPSGKAALLSFTVIGGSAQAKTFRVSLDEHLTSTKSMFT